MQAKTDVPNYRDVLMGILMGVGGLISIAWVLDLVDPQLRDPAGQVFSISEILSALGILG